MKTHKLKIEPEYLAEIIAGNKKCEIRIGDRDYQRGDILELFHLIKTDAIGDLDDREPDARVEVTHIHVFFGLQAGFVALSFNLLIDKPKVIINMPANISKKEADKIAEKILKEYKNPKISPINKPKLCRKKTKKSQSKSRKK